jgi:hypothetical protein
MPEADAAVERERNALEEATLAYEDGRLEWRAAQVQEARREEARALLREERERLREMQLATPVDGGTYGAAGGLVFGLEFRLKKAQRAGDQALVADYETKLTAARARLAELQPQLDAHNKSQQDLIDEYERRLKAMIHQ